MDATYITPFISSIQNVFSTMLQLPVNVSAPSLKTSPAPAHDVSGIIGMSGDVVGSVVLSFPESTAVAVVALFCGEKLDPGTPDFADAVGELVNMVSGGAKANFEGKNVSISTPSVVVGKGHSLASQSDLPCVCIPCETDCGVFSIEVAIREAQNAGATDTAETAAA